jgi:hypothetical protein
MVTGGGAPNVPTPACNSKTIEQVRTICAGQGIDVNVVCSAAFDQTTPRTRGTPKSAMRGAGGAKRPPPSVEFQLQVDPPGGDLTPAQTPSLSSALDPQWQ